MARNSDEFMAFMSESVPVRRWRLYSLRFLTLSLGCIGLQGLLGGNRQVALITFPTVAAILTIFNFVTDWRRANDRRRTTNDKRLTTHS